VPIPRRRKYGLLVLAIVAAAGCLALGWWQLSRWESNAGSFQNLGYALQWPLFAGFCLYAYRKFIRYEEAPPEPPNASGDVTEIPAGLLPDRPAASTPHADATLREYNAYLAGLADADGGAEHADHADQNRTTA
jgi:DNA-binding transcriptional regulator of glucitol operon